MADANKTTRFLRRYSRQRQVRPDGKRVIVSGEVFLAREGEPSISLTEQDATLASRRSLAAYQVAFELPSGDLPDFCCITSDDIEKAGAAEPARPLQPASDPQPGPFGGLHWSVPPPSVAQSELLALRAARNLVVDDLTYVPLIRRRERDAYVQALGGKREPTNEADAAGG